MARQLQLIPSKAEIISLSEFDSTSSSVKRVEAAYIHLQTDDQEPILLEVIIVPTIAAPLQKLTHVHPLAGSSTPTRTEASPPKKEDLSQIDLLIDANHYWNIVEDQIIRGCGPTVAKSKPCCVV